MRQKERRESGWVGGAKRPTFFRLLPTEIHADFFSFPNVCFDTKKTMKKGKRIKKDERLLRRLGGIPILFVGHQHHEGGSERPPEHFGKQRKTKIKKQNVSRFIFIKMSGMYKK